MCKPQKPFLVFQRRIKALMTNMAAMASQEVGPREDAPPSARQRPSERWPLCVGRAG